MLVGSSRGRSAPQSIKLSTKKLKFELLDDRRMLTGDVNGDGVVNDADLVELRSAFGQVGDNLPGDVNSDGIVDLADFQIVKDNQGLTISP
ncbi:MAG: hypothetical protein KDA71_07920, partial [Planctomycetales bacterium]|nr:hypothetical protein [Planctomycetales bacterium]